MTTPDLRQPDPERPDPVGPVAPAAWGPERTRTITWHDPMIGSAALPGMTGLQYLRAIVAGELPPAPIGQVIGMQALTVEQGRVVFTGTPDESVYNPIGVVHGGFVCTLLDSVAGCAVQTTLPAGTGYTSLEIKVSYLRPVRAGDGQLTATGWVTKPGRRAAFAAAEVTDEQQRVVATATSTCLVFPLS